MTIPPMHGPYIVVDFMPDSFPGTVDWHDWAIVDDVRVEAPTESTVT